MVYHDSLRRSTAVRATARAALWLLALGWVVAGFHFGWRTHFETDEYGVVSECMAPGALRWLSVMLALGGAGLIIWDLNAAPPRVRERWAVTTVVLACWLAAIIAWLPPAAQDCVN